MAQPALPSVRTRSLSPTNQRQRPLVPLQQPPRRANTEALSANKRHISGQANGSLNAAKPSVKGLKISTASASCSKVCHRDVGTNPMLSDDEIFSVLQGSSGKGSESAAPQVAPTTARSTPEFGVGPDGQPYGGSPTHGTLPISSARKLTNQGNLGVQEQCGSSKLDRDGPVFNGAEDFPSRVAAPRVGASHSAQPPTPNEASQAAFCIQDSPNPITIQHMSPPSYFRPQQSTPFDIDAQPSMGQIPFQQRQYFQEVHVHQRNNQVAETPQHVVQQHYNLSNRILGSRADGAEPPLASEAVAKNEIGARGVLLPVDRGILNQGSNLCVDPTTLRVHLDAQRADIERPGASGVYDMGGRLQAIRYRDLPVTVIGGEQLTMTELSAQKEISDLRKALNM